MSGQETHRLALFGTLLATVFVAGIAIGVIGNRLASNGPVIKTRFTGILDRLELTPQQRVQAESIVSRRAPRSESLMLKMAEQLRAVSDSVDAELRQILTPAQGARLDSLRVREPTFMLKRKVMTLGETTVDTVFTLPRDSGNRMPR